MHRILLTTLVLCCSALLQASPAERLAATVRFPTVSFQDPALVDQAAFRQLNDFLRASYPRVFGQLAVEVVNEYSLLITWAGTDPQAGAILFTAHTDVVPVESGTEADWTHPPFAGVMEDGVIYGRGTLDDKVGVISLLEAAEALLADGFAPRRTIVFAFGHDEEVGGREGAARIAQRLRELGLQFEWMVDEGGLVVTGSPALPDGQLAMINVAEKGYLTLILEAQGEGGHSSQPPRISTIGRLSRALARIEDQPFPARIGPPVDAMLAALAPHAPQPQRFVFENLWLTAPLVVRQMAGNRSTDALVRTTTALTMFNAGVKENVVPQRAEARVNFRLLPDTTAEMVVDHVTRVVDDPGVSIRYERWDNRPGVADHRAEGYTVIADAIRLAYPDAVIVPSLLVATTDTRHYVDLARDQYRFHGMLVPMADTSGIHGTDEQLSVEALEKAVLVAEGMLRNGAR
jgi:carboxypeptidase PM20D1